MNIMHIEAELRPSDDCGADLQLCYVTKGFTVSDRVWVNIEIVCVWDINGVLTFFKTWIFILASLEINCNSRLKQASFVLLLFFKSTSRNVMLERND